MSKNTLFNYFTKSPVVTQSSKKLNDSSVINKDSGNFITPVKTSNNSKKTPVRKVETKRKTREKENVESKESYIEERIEDSPPHKKRKRILDELDSEDSGEEYVPDHEESGDENISSGEPSSCEDSIDDKTDATPSPPKKKTQQQKKSQLNTSLKLEKFRNSLSNSTACDKAIEFDNWPHLQLEFLKPNMIRDSNNRKPTDSNYDPKTIFVPEEFKKNLTPGVRQWWELKSKNYDVVLFFKVGKFYELYHMDAVVAANELNLTFMKGDFAHVGFPEIAYSRFSSTLVEKGFKVARIEQTETPDMMAERCKNTKKCTKFDKVVRREICQITSRGTRISNVLDGECSEAESRYLLAIAEKEIDNGNSYYGVCFIDTTIGIFHLSQFKDDRHSSRLRTLIAQYPPVQVLYEKGHISLKFQLLLNTVLSNITKDQLNSDTEFLSSSKTLIALKEGDFFTDNIFPETLTKFLGQESYSNMLVNDDCELAVRSFGAVIWYLKRCLLDHQIISMGKFEIYNPVDLSGQINITPNYISDNKSTMSNHMILDAIALKNLSILENFNGSLEGTLIQKLDNCCTPFGKRLLHNWICNPLLKIKSIESRQLAVTCFKNCHELKEIRDALSQIPDLERLLSKIYSQGSNGLKPDHPDTRAVMFEEKKYSKKKIVDFISILNGFKRVNEIIEMMQEISELKRSDLISRYCSYENQEPSGLFPVLAPHLEYFQKSFDPQEAEKEGRILPKEGMDEDYDEAVRNLKILEKELANYLKQQCQYFGCQVKYVGTDKKRYQLEVPEYATKRAGDDYELQSQRKGFRRYSTEKTKELLDQIIIAEEQKTNVLKNLRQRIFAKFSEKSAIWMNAVQCLAVLDVLMSFAEYCRTEQNVTCVPKFVELSKNGQSFVQLVDGRYPCGTGDDVFIPNNTFIGSEEGADFPNLVLVTGPNMGGKSTLMRQLGLIVIMAHLGCPVPASELKLSLVDRIFTRIGANDDIMVGESTFYVELCETSSILQHATKHSLVLIDELGRGTSTYDGTAIAASVVNELCQIGSRTLFSTHYHSLVEDFKTNPKVQLGHMSCMVENDADDGTEETVIFLYKFVEGACPKSYGFNAARLAGIPQHITKVGRLRAKQFEDRIHKRLLFKQFFETNIDKLYDLINTI